MKYQTTKRDIMQRFDVVFKWSSVDLSRILYSVPPFAYTAGTLGHNADVYDITDFMPKDFHGSAALTYGNRPFGTHNLPHEIGREYWEKSKQADFYDPKFKSEMNRLLRNMLKKVCEKELSLGSSR